MIGRSVHRCIGSSGDRAIREPQDVQRGPVVEPITIPDAPAVLTVDVEDWFCVCGDEFYSDWRRWDRLPSRVEATTRALLDLLDASRRRATFFVLGWVARRFGGLVREIARRGHEIASHGLSHARLDALASGERRREMRESRALLEDVSGAPVQGFRAAEWSIRSPEDPALRELAEEGYAYDASMTDTPPLGRADNPAGVCRFRFADHTRIVEIAPLSGRVLGRRLPLGGAWPFRLLPWARIEEEFERSRRAGRPPVFTTHPWEVDPAHPSMDGLDPLLRLVHFSGRRRTRGRLQRLLAVGQFATMGDVRMLADGGR